MTDTNEGSPDQLIRLTTIDGVLIGDYESFDDAVAKLGSKSPARKMASAMIAKIPEPLARHIARTFKPI